MGLFIALVIAGSSYYAGKAAQKVEVYESKEVCFDESYNDREKGCYQVSKTPAKTPEVANK